MEKHHNRKIDAPSGTALSLGECLAEARGWKLSDGIAYSPTVDFLRYENSDVVNRWNKIERPGVYIEDGIVRAMTFSVLDLPKEEDKGNDGHASKVIVVPFDGEALNQFAKEQYYGK